MWQFEIHIHNYTINSLYHLLWHPCALLSSVLIIWNCKQVSHHNFVFVVTEIPWRLPYYDGKFSYYAGNMLCICFPAPIMIKIMPAIISASLIRSVVINRLSTHTHPWTHACMHASMHPPTHTYTHTYTHTNRQSNYACAWYKDIFFVIIFRNLHNHYSHMTITAILMYSNMILSLETS